MTAYRIKCSGDGACVVEVCGWGAVVNGIAAIMFHEPGESERDEVRGLLEHGIDGDPGWDGRYVCLTFEDGCITVELLEQSDAVA